MSLFQLPDFDNHEHVSYFTDDATGLKAIIAIHNTNLGPSLGGCRFWYYGSEEEALVDALRLSRGMTYKSALARLPLGGGKAVILGDKHLGKTPELLAAFARCVDQLGGLYITAEDVGTSPDDMAIIHQHTAHVVGLSNMPGGSGDPSVFTAYGVLVGLRACLAHLFNTQDFSSMHVALQGLGHVGMLIARDLHAQGARLTVTDVNPVVLTQAQDLFGATIVAPEEIYSVSCDVFSPCALGGVLNDYTIKQLNCKVVAGSANNQLGDGTHGYMLKDRGILYAPDYLINAGGIINVTYEGPHYDQQVVFKHVDGIYDTMTEILQYAECQNIPTNVASDHIAEQRFCKKL